jgi:hypothetical protein
MEKKDNQTNHILYKAFFSGYRNEKKKITGKDFYNLVINCGTFCLVNNRLQATFFRSPCRSKPATGTGSQGNN